MSRLKIERYHFTFELACKAGKRKGLIIEKLVESKTLWMDIYIWCCRELFENFKEWSSFIWSAVNTFKAQQQAEMMIVDGYLGIML